MKKLRFTKLIVFVLAALILNGCGKTPSALERQTAASAVLPSEKTAVSDAIGFLENRIKRDPDDFIAHNKLAAQYLQKTRETGDQNFLALASRAARASLMILPAEQNKEAIALLAQVEYAAHDFASARDHALQLAKLEPNKGYPYQILGDALLELGQYEEATNAFRQMETLGGFQPLMKVGIEQRLARLALLYGDNNGAKRHFSRALKIALEMPVSQPEPVAWCRWQLGDTAFAEGDYKTAEQNYLSALESLPNHSPTIASLGRVRAAAGDLTGAIEQYERAVRLLPDPHFVVALGDLYRLAGREEDARRQYELVEQIGNLSKSGGAIYNRQLALFYANHDLNAEEAYRLTAREYETRRDIYGADALAWTAFKAGRLDEAQAAIKQALRLGTRDAQLFYHAGMIEAGLGNRKKARHLLEKALRLNPMFDLLQAENARKALQKLK